MVVGRAKLKKKKEPGQAEEAKRIMKLNPMYTDLYSAEFRKAFNATSTHFNDLYKLREDLIFKQLDKEFGIDLGILESLLIEESQESWERLGEVFIESGKKKAIPLVAQVAEYNALIAEIDSVSIPSEEEPRYGRGSNMQEHVRILMQAPYESGFLHPYWKARKLLMGDRRKSRNERSKAFKDMEIICEEFKEILLGKYETNYEEIIDWCIHTPFMFILTTPPNGKKIEPNNAIYFAQIFEFEALKAKRGRKPKKQKEYEEAVHKMMTLYYKS